MKTATARLFALILSEAADRAEEDGFDELAADDLDLFATADDDARAELLAAIAAAERREA